MNTQLNHNREPNIRYFILLWISQSVSELGSAMTAFGLALWAFGQKGTAMSMVSLSIFSYLPYVLISFAAGTLADRWKKKHIMLACDTLAAMGSLTVLALLLAGRLSLWHLYAVNLVIGFMNAFQQPASMVAVTMLTPRRYYTNISGLQAFSQSLTAILSPVLAASLISFGGIYLVLAVDLSTFVVAFISLAFFIPLPEERKQPEPGSGGEGFWRQCVQGIRYLQGKRAVWKMILFFALVNFLSSMAGNSLMPAMILSRTDNNRQILGLVSSCLGFGTMAGSLVAAVSRPPESRKRAIFLSCGVSFLLCDVLWAVGRDWRIWALAALMGNFPLPLLNASMSAVVRGQIPVEMQGRAFSTQATFQFFTIPMGYLAGGLLSDYVFEPFMRAGGPLQRNLGVLVGEGKGSGMALIFFITGVCGFLLSLAALRDKTFDELDSFD